MDKKISIVIPNYNGAKLLAMNLPKVIGAAGNYSPDTEVIVVDDNSDDDSVNMVISKFPTVKIYKREKNEGFAATVNLGIKSAQGDIVVLLNSDVYPEKDLLSKVVPIFNKNDVFAVGFLDLSLENGREIERGRGIGKFERGMFIHSRGETDKANTLWASGGSSAFERSKWLALGGMDETYNPFYWEDIDLSYRALKKGWKIIFARQAVVHHNHKLGSILQKYSVSDIKTIAYRNQFIFIWKNITEPKLIAQHFLWLPVHILKALWRFDKEYISGYLQALIRMFTKMPHKERDAFLSDEEILSQYKN